MAKPSPGVITPTSLSFSPASDQSTVSHLKVTVQVAADKPDGTLVLAVTSGNVAFAISISDIPVHPEYKRDDRLVLEYPKGQNPMLATYSAIYHADQVSPPQPKKVQTMSDLSTVQNNALIPTFQSTIGGQPALCCDGRALHTFLKNGDKFADWIKGRIGKYDFAQGKDYEGFSEKTEKPQGGRPATEYNLSINMAKELSMVENNEQGKIARRYFIECERIALGQVETPKRAPTIPDTAPKLSKAQIAAAKELLRGYAKDLKISATSMAGAYLRLEEQAGFKGLLPHYVVDAPAGSTTGSSEAPLSATELLKRHGVDMSAVSFNRLLMNAGFLEEKTRPSSKGGEKSFKSVTNFEYGKNETSTSNPRETQPLWWPSKFEKLLELVLPKKLEVVA